MKKCFVSMLAILSLFIMTGCGGGSPKKVAEKWFKAIMNGDVNAANAVSTAKTHEMNKFYIEMSKGHSEDIKKAKIAYTEMLEEDHGGVVITVDEKECVVSLVKQDGKWLVDTDVLMEETIKKLLDISEDLMETSEGVVDTPKKVAEKWFKAIINGDVNTANAVSTTKTQTLNALVIAGMMENSEELEKMKKAEFKYEETIDGDKATVTIIAEGEEGDKIELVKQDGKWLVDVEKE